MNLFRRRVVAGVLLACMLLLAGCDGGQAEYPRADIPVSRSDALVLTGFSIGEGQLEKDEWNDAELDALWGVLARLKPVEAPQEGLAGQAASGPVPGTLVLQAKNNLRGNTSVAFGADYTVVSRPRAADKWFENTSQDIEVVWGLLAA